MNRAEKSRSIKERLTYAYISSDDIYESEEDFRNPN